MVELEVEDRSELGEYGIEFLEAEDYEKVAKYAKGNFAKEFASIRYEALKTQFEVACGDAEEAQGFPPAEAEERWKEIAEEFEWAEEYPGAAEWVQECRKRAVKAGQAKHFNNACALVEEAQSGDPEVAAEVWEHAAQEFELAAEHPQAQERAQECCERAKQSERAKQFKEACGLMKEAEACGLVGAQAAWERAARVFDLAGDYPQAQENAQHCYECAAQAVRNLAEANRRIEEAAELVKGAQERFEAAKIDLDGAIEAEFKRIQALIQNIDELDAAETVARDCCDGARKARDSRVAGQERREKRKRKRNLIIAACVAVAIAAAAAAYLLVIRPAIITLQAEGLVAAGDYESAIDLYVEMGMADEAKACRSSMLANLEVGDTVVFGSYEQDGNATNGAEAIEWVALAKEGDKTLLVSRYALDCQPYNTSRTSVTWEDCTLRSWLNGPFLSTAFTEDEQTLIDDTHVINADNGEYDTPGGNPTVDKVFLLSIDEVEKCFSSDGDRACTVTAHAKDQGAQTDGNGGCSWWLRSPGGDSDIAANVNLGGSVDAAAGVSSASTTLFAPLYG